MNKDYKELYEELSRAQPRYFHLTYHGDFANTVAALDSPHPDPQWEEWMDYYGIFHEDW